MASPQEELAGVLSVRSMRRLLAVVIAVLGANMVLTLVASVWEWEDVVFAGEPPEADEWLAVVAVALLPLITTVLVRLIRLYLRMRVAAETAVQAFQDTVQAVDGWIWRTDADLRLTYSSQGVTTLLGVAPGPIFGAPIAELLGGGEAPPVAGTEWRSSARHADGTVRHLRTTATPVHDRDGRIVAYHGFTTDLEQREEREQREAARARITALLHDENALRIVVQPIVDLESGRAVGAEALSRFAGEPYRPPNVWFDEAWQAGLGPDLELRAVAAAFERLPDLPAHVYLSVNVAPETMLDPRFPALLDRLGRDTARIVVEITEHAVVSDYTALIAAVAAIRRRGARLAVDDAGAGYASMQHILRLRPDVIKLDRSIVDRADQDPARRALMAAMAAFAASLGTAVVAEGVETAEEVGVLLDSGIRLGQGFHLGRPEAVWPAVRVAATL